MNRAVGEGEYRCISGHFVFISYCKSSHSLFLFSDLHGISPIVYFSNFEGFCVPTNCKKLLLNNDSPGKCNTCLCPRLLRRCSLLKISPSVKAIGTHAKRPDSLLPPTLCPEQRRTLVFCSASTLLLCRGKAYQKHTLICTIGSKSALIFFVCNSRVTQLA